MKLISYYDLKELYEKALSDFYGKEIRITIDEFNDDLSNASYERGFTYKGLYIEEFTIEISNHKRKIDYFDYYVHYDEDNCDISYFVDEEDL